MEDLTEGTLADLHTLMGRPPKLRRGNTQLVNLPNPAAGASLYYQVSDSWWERVIGLQFTFTAGATSASRQLAIAYQDSTPVTFLTAPLLAVVAAGQAVTVSAHLEGGQGGVPVAAPSVYGTVTSPAAAAAIATTSTLQPGTYLVEWSVELGGTVAAGVDNDNFQVRANATQWARSINEAAVAAYPQENVLVDLEAAGGISVNAVSLATTGAIYSASLTAIPQATTAISVQLIDLILKSEWGLAVTVTNIQATDQISAVTLLTERYPSNWADGSLNSDEEYQARRIAAWLAREHATTTAWQ